MLFLMLFSFPNISFADVPIQGKPSATQGQCIRWMQDKDVEQQFIDLVPYIFEECEKANIDPVLVIAQCSLETAYFTSYNFRKNHNSAGIKRRGNTNEYQYYNSYREGFRAQICHLALYSGNPQEDYYYSSRLDGWVTTVEGLAGTWAEDRNYDQKVITLMRQIQAYEVPNEEIVVEEVVEEEKEDVEVEEPIIEEETIAEEKPNKEIKKESNKKSDKIEERKKEKTVDKKSPTDIIDEILKRKKGHSSGYYKIYEYLK